MNTQDEIKALKERIAELEQQEKQEFPQYEKDYWYVDSDTEVIRDVWYGDSYDDCDQGRLSIDNVFKTKNQAEFVAEKLRVEAELRKFSRPFKEGEKNHFIVFTLRPKTILIDSDEDLQTHGTVYFETIVAAFQAIEAVGADRIKKYIFGMEE